MSNNISVQNLLESFKHLGYANGGIENFINSEMVRNIDLADSSSIDKLFESYLGLFSEYSQQDPMAIYTLVFLVDNFNPNSANLDPYLKVITKDLDWHINYLSNNFNTSSKMSDIRKGILLFVEKITNILMTKIINYLKNYLRDCVMLTRMNISK